MPISQFVWHPLTWSRMSNDLPSSILGTWFGDDRISKLRFCSDGSWHQFSYAAGLGRRWMMRVTFHGRFTLEGASLTMTTDRTTCIRWKSGAIEKEKNPIDHYAAIISPIALLNDENLVLGDHIRQIGDERTHSPGTATYQRTKPH